MEMPLNADGDEEQEKGSMALSARRKVPTAVAYENKKEKLYSQLRGNYM